MVYNIICSMIWKLVTVFISGFSFSNTILKPTPQSFCLLEIGLVWRMVSEIANKILYRRNWTRMSPSDGQQMCSHPNKICLVLWTASDETHVKDCWSVRAGLILCEVEHWNNVLCRYRGFSTNLTIDSTALNYFFMHYGIV